MRRVCAVLLAALVALSGFAPVTAAAATGGSGLTAIGDQAVQDLSTCLASQDVLNVYYLIDSSGSLESGVDGAPGSDPDALRATILANSLSQLGGVRDDVTVNWAAGFFSTAFSATIPWRTYDEGGPTDLDDAIRDREPDGYTNWPEALRGAQSQLARQQSSDPGCQLLIWLTDGQLDTQAPNGPGPEDYDALNRLCGDVLDPRGAEPSGNGIFNSFRQSGVVVVGALLATTAAAKDAGQVMRPLIEGEGGGKTCPQHPIPAGYVAGAFVEATSPDALAQVFQQLGAQVAGGRPFSIATDGSFWIDPGVSRFRIVTSDNWSLEPPVTSDFEPVGSGESAAWLTVDPTGGVLEASTTDERMHGRWRLVGSDASALFLFSDLRIVFEPTNDIELQPDGTSTSTLRAQLKDADGAPVGAKDFQPGTLSAAMIDLDGERQELPGAEVDIESGAIIIPVPADVSASEILVEASLDPLVTTGHGLELAPLTTQQRVKTVLPGDYPHVSGIPVRLSALEGRNGVATGSLTLTGPADGDGIVCLPATPTIQSDSAERAQDSWSWTWDDALDASGCVTIAAEQSLEIALSVANSEAADSRVLASVPVGLRSADGPELVQEVPIEFTSTHPVNVAAVGLIAVILLLLGVLLPLVALWVVNWWTTRLSIDNGIQRAAFPITISRSGTVFTDAPASDTGLSERFRYRADAGDARALEDPDLGRIGAVIPWFPLIAPKYALTPRGDRVILAARTGARGASGEWRDDGTVRFSQLPFNALWAVVAPRDAVRRFARDGELRATAVLYHRQSSVVSQYRDRLAEVAGDSAVLPAVERLSAELAEEAAARPASRDRGPDSAVEAAIKSRGVPPVSQPTARTSSAAPPRPGTDASSVGSAPPPRPSSPPPRPGGAPPRPNAEPPSGGSPPPRPSR